MVCSPQKGGLGWSRSALVTIENTEVLPNSAGEGRWTARPLRASLDVTLNYSHVSKLTLWFGGSNLSTLEEGKAQAHQKLVAETELGSSQGMRMGSEPP